MEKQTKYTDYLVDIRFIRWQLMPDEELTAYWEEYLERHPDSTQEMQQAVSYLKKEGLNKKHFNEFEQQQLLKKIQHTIGQREQKKRRKIIWYSSVASAAVFAIVFAIGLFLSSRDNAAISSHELIVGEMLNNEDIQLITRGESMSFQNDITVTIDQKGTAEIVQSNSETSNVDIGQDKTTSLIVPYGKRTMLTLADGSRIWLNSGSMLEFPAQFNGKTREICLKSGEMYVEVVHDQKRPFHVQTTQFNVRVYGTKFNLSTYDGAPHSLVLVEGSVGLQSINKKELILKPHQQAIYSESGAFETRNVDANMFTCWKDGFLAFDKTPMTEVLQQIGRYYNLTFDFEKDNILQKRTCTGKIYLSENLDNVMTTIELLTSTRYEKQENHIFITNKSK